MKKAERTGKPVRGASTITNQCARSIFLWQGRSWLRKGLESYYTLWMEALLPKRRILELYANVIEMGCGIYGVEAAAKQSVASDPILVTMLVLLPVTTKPAISEAELAPLVAISPNGNSNGNGSHAVNRLS